MPTIPASRTAFQHFVITKMNLRLRHLPPPSRAWLERRLDLFESLCLPSLLGQPCRNFTWLLLFEPDTPPELEDRIRSYGRDDSPAVCIVKGVHFREFIRLRLRPDTRVLVTTRLDSDDALHRDAIGALQRHVSQFLMKGGAAQLFSFRFGYTLHTEKRRIYRREYPENAFITLFEDLSNTREFGTVRKLPHKTMVARHDTFFFDRFSGWLITVHGSNVTNSVHPHQLPSALSRAELHDEFYPAFEAARKWDCLPVNNYIYVGYWVGATYSDLRRRGKSPLRSLYALSRKLRRCIATWRRESISFKESAIRDATRGPHE